MEFATTLKSLIRRRGLTTARLAESVSVSAKTINDWLTGRVPRDMDAVRRCAQVLDVSVHYLLYGEEDPKGSIGFLLNKTEVHAGLYEITIKKVTEKKEP